MKKYWMALAGAFLTCAMVFGIFGSATAQVSGNRARDNDAYSCTVPTADDRGTCVCRSPFSCREMILDRVCVGNSYTSVELTECRAGTGECSCRAHGRWRGRGPAPGVDHRDRGDEGVRDGGDTTDHRDRSNETSDGADEPRQIETVPARRGSGQGETVPARRGSSNSETVPSRRGRLTAPSQLMLGEIQATSLTLVWMDNTSIEHGVSVERGTPTSARGGINYHWEHVFNVEERVESRMEGTGLRSDGDDGLSPDTEYCYRLRAYRNDVFSDYSAPVCAQTLQ